MEAFCLNVFDGLHGMEQVRVTAMRLERCEANGLAYRLLHRLASRDMRDTMRRAAPPPPPPS